MATFFSLLCILVNIPYPSHTRGKPSFFCLRMQYSTFLLYLNRWVIKKKSVSVTVTEGNTELPLNSLVIGGFDVTGFIKSNEDPVADINVLLYKHADVSNLWIFRKKKFIFCVFRTKTLLLLLISKVVKKQHLVALQVTNNFCAMYLQNQVESSLFHVCNLENTTSCHSTRATAYSLIRNALNLLWKAIQWN